MEKRARVCNCCGRELAQKEDAFCAHKEWGYFSEKDTQIHEFLLCEACYDEITKRFCVPVRVTEQTELL